jgi:hypothetical protein
MSRLKLRRRRQTNISFRHRTSSKTVTGKPPSASQRAEERTVRYRGARTGTLSTRRTLSPRTLGKRSKADPSRSAGNRLRSTSRSRCNARRSPTSSFRLSTTCLCGAVSAHPSSHVKRPAGAATTAVLKRLHGALRQDRYPDRGEPTQYPSGH